MQTETTNPYAHLTAEQLHACRQGLLDALNQPLIPAMAAAVATELVLVNQLIAARAQA